MPPKKTSERLDITLPEGLVRRIRDRAEERETTISGLIGEAVRAYLDGGSTPSSPGQVMLSSDIETLIQERITRSVEEHLSRLPGTSIPAREPCERREPIKIPKEKEVPLGKVQVPDDIKEKMKRYTAATLANAINAVCNPGNDSSIQIISRGTLQGFVKGNAKTTKAEYMEQIIRGLETLETQETQKNTHTDLSGFSSE